MSMFYQQMIRESMAQQGLIGRANPAHVEAWMRLEHGTLDALSAAQFDAEVRIGIDCANASTEADNDRLAEMEGCADSGEVAR